MSASRSRFLTCLLLPALLAAPGWAVAENGEGAAGPRRTILKTDFLDGAYMPGLESVVVAGHHGLIGQLKVGESGATLDLLQNHPDEDFTALAAVSDKEVLIGGATGRLYRYDGSSVTEVASLSEYDEPVLDIAVDGSNVWVVGARGLIARSSDGTNFEAVEIANVVQPVVSFPAGQPADWYLGVSNLDPESIEFTATVGGEPAKADTDYTVYPDEGFVQVINALDEDPPPAISFKFNPGPPFRAGDVSWNVVLAQNGKITIAGEFGMVLQSEDNGATWIRRDAEVVPHEPEPSYWMAGVQNGDEIWLAGAAGISQVSHDGGVTWTDSPKAGREGIFGITLSKLGKPVIAGAVGLIGVLENDDWALADRTHLHLLSWLKRPITMPDGSLLVLGGRATAIRFKDGEWSRVPVEL
jgi:photosystem II stability/assembly factor-like uncharacterized protein